MLVLGRKTNVVGKCRRHVQVDATTRRFAAQEIGLHLDIAIAEQHGIDAPARPAEILNAVGGADRPIGRAALFQFAPVVLQHLGGIASVLGGKLRTDRSQFVFSRHLGQDPARLQLHDGAFNRLAQTGLGIAGLCQQRHHGLAILGDTAGFGKIIQKGRYLAIGGKAHMTDRVHDQRAAGADRQQMNEAGAAENHSCLV